MPKPGFYAVASGRQVGIFKTWDECDKMVKGYPGACFKKFSTESAASQFIADNKEIPSTRNYSSSSTFNSNRSNSRQNFKRSNSSESGQLSKKPRVDVETRKMTPTKSNGEMVMLPFEVDQEDYVSVYTDGACLGNGHCGSTAGVGVWFGDNHPLNISRRVDGVETNNNAEIQAARMAMELAYKAGIKKLKVKTDSKFLINCATQWMDKWKNNGWKLTTGGDVKNRSELEKLDKAMKKVQVLWDKVPAHSGVHGNEMADRLANLGASSKKYK